MSAFYRPCPIRDLFYRRCGLREPLPEKAETEEKDFEVPTVSDHQQTPTNEKDMLDMFLHWRLWQE